MAMITFHGAAREVTGSCHLLESPACGRLLLDCGMHQGGDAVDRVHEEGFAFDPRSIDAVVLSHAHLDHCGMLPRLYEGGFRGPVYCTHATAELLEIMLYDAVGLYLRDLERENRRNARAGRPIQEPVYTEDDVDGVLRACIGSDYGQRVELGAGAVLCFHDAGHILGSAIVELLLNDGDAQKRLVFSGDLGKDDSVLMRPPQRLAEADLVLLESTYGDREHKDEENTLPNCATCCRDLAPRRQRDDPQLCRGAHAGNPLLPGSAAPRR
jgi:metallo-beta-lactamase family protein